MGRQLTVLVENSFGGEDGLTNVCREGRLFRNDHELENLFKEGYRIYNYDVIGEERAEGHPVIRVQVHLEK